MSVSQWEVKHSVCHVIAKTDRYVTTSFWGQACMCMCKMMVIHCGRIRSGSSQRTGQLPLNIRCPAFTVFTFHEIPVQNLGTVLFRV